MDITVICRTYNEHKHIDRFCQKYSWADKILIADGKSDDDTVKRAHCYPNVEVRYFYPRVWRNGVSYNPEGKHINYLINWAVEEGTDWIVMDDCDSCPTQALQEDARKVLSSTPAEIIGAFRLYLYHTDQWFPSLTGGGSFPPPSVDPKTGKLVRWQGLWAWRAGLALRWDESDPWQNQPLRPERFADNTFNWDNLNIPYALLHYFCLDDAEIERKLDLYQKGKDSPDMKHPLESYGALAPLPDWAKP